MRRKAVAGPIAHVRSGCSAAGSRLLFIHPGGLPAIFAYADKLGSWLSKTPARPSGSGAGSRIAPDGVRGRPARGLGLVEDPFCIGEIARPATGPAWIGPSGQTRGRPGLIATCHCAGLLEAAVGSVLHPADHEGPDAWPGVFVFLLRRRAP